MISLTVIFRNVAFFRIDKIVFIPHSADIYIMARAMPLKTSDESAFCANLAEVRMSLKVPSSACRSVL